MTYPINLIVDALLNFYFIRNEKKNIIHIKRVIAVSRAFKKIITTSLTYYNTRLYIESYCGDLDTIKYLLNRGSSYTYLGYKPLRAALSAGNIPVVRHYIKCENNRINQICEDFLYQLMMFGFNHHYLINEYINSRALSIDIIHDFLLTKCIEEDSIELFNVIRSCDIIDHDNNFKNLIIQDILVKIIYNSRHHKLFKYIMEIEEINILIYANPMIKAGVHILTLIIRNNKYALLNYVDISKFKKSYKLINNCMEVMMNKDYTITDYKYIKNFMYFILDNYKKINYELIIYIICELYMQFDDDESCKEALNKIIIHGANVEDILYRANKWNIILIKEYIYSSMDEKQITEINDKLFARALKDNEIEPYRKYIKNHKLRPDKFMNSYIDRLYN